MTMVLIIGGGVADPVTAMALQRAEINAVVSEAYAPTTGEEVGFYLTVATNGIGALRAIGAATPVLDAGFPVPINLLLSGTGRRLGTVSSGVLPDGTTAHTIKRARASGTHPTRSRWRRLGRCHELGHGNARHRCRAPKRRRPLGEGGPPLAAGGST